MNYPPAFLEAVLAEPEDDLPRLVYADWLEEQADDLGAFIRLDCELARRPEGDPARAELSARRDALFLAGGGAWLAPLRGIQNLQLRWDRGLAVCAVWLNDFLSHHSALTHCRPVLGVEVTCFADELTYLSPVLWEEVRPLPRLISLRVSDPSHTPLEVIEELWTSPFLPRLASLKLSTFSHEQLNLKRLVRLISSPELRRLTVQIENMGHWLRVVGSALRQPGGPRELDLSADPWLREYGKVEGLLEQLGRLPALASVRTLRLRQLSLHGHGVIEVLARSPYLSGLTHLDLGSLATDPGYEAGSANIFTDYLDVRSPGREFSPGARAFCVCLQQVVIGVDHDWHDATNEQFLCELFPVAEVFVDDALSMCGGTTERLGQRRTRRRN
jgi:uncharacterized protein (TIGR02996 family)